MYAKQIKQWFDAGVTWEAAKNLLMDEPYSCTTPEDMDAAEAYWNFLSSTKTAASPAASPVSSPAPAATDSADPPAQAAADSADPSAAALDENSDVPAAMVMKFYETGVSWDDVRTMLEEDKFAETAIAAAEEWWKAKEAEKAAETEPAGETEDAKGRGEINKSKVQPMEDRRLPGGVETKQGTTKAPFKDEKTTDATGAAMTDNRNFKPPTQPAAQSSTAPVQRPAAQVVHLQPGQVILDRKTKLELDKYLMRSRQADAEQAFTDQVEGLFKTQDGKDIAELTDANKSFIRNLAKNAKTHQEGMILASYETARLIDQNKNQSALDSRRRSMGYQAGLPGGQVRGAVVKRQDAPFVGQALFDNLHDEINDGIRQRTIDIKDHGGDQLSFIARRNERKESMAKTPFFRALQESYLDWGDNSQALTDAITNSDIHGVTTVLNRDKILEWAVIEQIFFSLSISENCVTMLAPGAYQQRFPMGPSSGARPVDLGGVFVMGLETVQENKSAVAKNYKIGRHAGRIPLVNTGFEHNSFVTSSRMSGIVVDSQSARQMISGPFLYDIWARASFQQAGAITRAIDTELGQDMIASTREFGAVNVASAETPAGNGTSTGEWFFNAGGSAAGYGTNVKAVHSTKGPYATLTLKTSWENGINYPAPLVPPRVKTYVHGLTGVTTDVVLFPINIVHFNSATPIEGFFDPETKNVLSYEDAPGATWAPDTINGRILYTGLGGETAANKNTATYWYATNYIYWSKQFGRWKAGTNEFSSGLIAGTLLPDRAMAYIDEADVIAGDLGQKRLKPPAYALGRWDLQNGYAAKAATFHQRISPAGSELYLNYGKSNAVGQSSGDLVHLKTANPRWSASGISIANMGASSSVLIGPVGETFYALGFIYPDTGMERVTYAPNGGGFTEAVNAMRREMGFLDAVGTPIYADGRNFGYIEVLFVD